MDPNSENRLIRALEEVAYELRSKREQAGEPTWAPEHGHHTSSVPISEVRQVAKLLQADIDYLERNQQLPRSDRWACERAGGYRRALYLIENLTGVRP